MLGKDLKNPKDLAHLIRKGLPAESIAALADKLQLGSSTLSQKLALLVPSAAIRGEWNVLLNPAHPEFSRIEFRKPVPFEFDARMFRGRE